MTRLNPGSVSVLLLGFYLFRGRLQEVPLYDPDDDAGTPDAVLDNVTYSPNPGKPLYIGMGAPERPLPDPGPL